MEIVPVIFLGEFLITSEITLLYKGVPYELSLLFSIFLDSL